MDWIAVRNMLLRHASTSAATLAAARLMRDPGFLWSAQGHIYAIRNSP
ncbi:MAG TPA: hypothetical protein VGF53_03560 [Pseudolabrys sp.]|jgi:hypothetical protein